MRYDAIFIMAGLACLLFGESFGIWMGTTANFQLSPSHAHLNLVGWVTLSLYGLIYRAYPTLSAAKLAPFQCLASVAGAIVLPMGIAIAIRSGDSQPQMAIAGSLLVLAGTLLFAIMFIGKAVMAKA